MANCCWGDVVFHGEKEKVHALFKKMESLQDDRGEVRLLALKEKLELDYEGDCRYYIDDIRIENETSLWVNVELAWDGHEALMEAIAKSHDLQWCAQYGLDDGWGVTNDNEKQFFKDDYFLDAEDSPLEVSKWFETEQEAVKYLEEKTGLVKTADEWSELCYNDEELVDLLGEEWDDVHIRLWKIDRDTW